MKVLNTNAKIPYEYNRYEWSVMTREELHDALYERAVYNPKNRHRKLHTVGNKNGRGITYYDICCGFDCETYTDEALQLSYMYIWQFSINKNVVRGRTYEELLELLDAIKDILNPKENHRLLCLIHNMGYEFSFFRGWLNLNNAKENFLKEERKPLKLTHDGFIEFRDSMALVGGDSLKGLAKDYCNTQKCVGDLQYDVPKNRYTILDELENSYVDNDVLILAEFAEYLFTKVMTEYTKLPLTQTGLLTNESKYYLNASYKHVGTWHKHNILRSAPDEATYNVHMNFLYRGGFTHACVDYVDRQIGLETDGNDLMGVDITSSYPYVCTQKVFPKMWEKIGKVSAERVNQDIRTGLVSIFIAKFKHIKTKGIHCIESKSKCIKLSPYAVIDNGRVYEAHEYTDEDGNKQPGMVVYLTSFDWQNYQHFYDFDESDVSISVYWVSETRYLYKHIAVPMLHHYKSKAVKKAKGEPYSEDKKKVNSYYGFLCKKFNGEQTKYDNNGFSTDDAKPYEEQLASAIVCAYDGIFVSSVAKWRLLSFEYDLYTKFGTPGIYADTDSWKILNPTKEVVEYIEEVNRKIREDNKDNIEYFTEYDEVYADLGEWDIEFYPWSMYDPNSKKAYLKRFMTLGAKRYLIEVDEYNKKTGKRERVLHQTVAGLPKGELIKQYGTIDNCFDNFTDKMEIECCKLYPHYVDTPYKITVTDTQGNTDTRTELSCCALLPTNFRLTIDEIWKQFYIGIAENNLSDKREHRIV